MASILVVDDEAPIASLLADHLTRRGHSVRIESNGDQTLDALGLTVTSGTVSLPDLVVLDVMLPGASGLEVCAALRRAEVPRQPVVLMLTAKRDEADAVAGFEAGADDYVRKPFGVAELVRRIEALLALAARAPSSSPRARGLRIDTRARTVHVDEREVHLTPKEHDLLVHLASHRGLVLDRETLLVEVWGYSHAGYARTVDSHVTRVRKKLEAAGLGRDPITTVHGVGYRFEDA
jgi:DNA-binding response OmpR family regulator